MIFASRIRWPFETHTQYIYNISFTRNIFHHKYIFSESWIISLKYDIIILAVCFFSNKKKKIPNNILRWLFDKSPRYTFFLKKKHMVITLLFICSTPCLIY